MVAKKTPIKPLAGSNEEGEGKQGGSGGRGSTGATGIIPSFNELIAVSPEEAELARCAKDALFAQRVSLKSQGHKVSALDKKQELRNQYGGPSAALSGGSNLEEHPELPEMAGVFDDIVFPESEAEAAASNDPDLALRNQLKNRLGMGLSMQTLREELRKEEKLRARPNLAPEPKPELVLRPSEPAPRPTPRFTPRPY